MSLRAPLRWPCDSTSHALDALAGDEPDEVEVVIGGATVTLSLEGGRLTAISIEKASALLAPDLLLDAKPVDDAF